ncbi:peptidoglycan-binding domain-containing protein [Fredinandcohnia sp. 179-A 10B2 NHS]|uniref:peptidoglycan-binding domain-containing protein n=1 Tax=Fredinandcohnia sp. 179-A 10B2 NHS TaxID=3235176 RepID=UPI00399FD6AA
MNDVQASLNRDFKGVEPPEPSPTPVVAGVSTRLPIKEGDRGPFVKEIQQDLIKAGFALPRYGADGSFGPETENAVMRFQKRYGLVVDGLVGPNTLARLQEVLRQSNSDDDFPLPNVVLRRGDTGENVRMLQRALKHLRFDPKQIDGSYGPQTEDAVRRFQSMFAALKDDGIFGPNTRKYMRMELND